MNAPPTIPDHDLLRRIGGGSYGEVWLARSATGAMRAVKILHRAAFDHDRPYDREFTGLKNFEPISRAHDGLVDILQVGRNDAAGYFYYVMELADDGNAEGQRPDAGSQMPDDQGRDPVPGGSTTSHPPSTAPLPSAYHPLTLESLIRAHGRVPVPECLRIAATLADALGYLHEQGLVHRDIKPSNIIFVDGMPKLADVGLVARTDSARSFVGTEGFVAPEGPGTPRADLYSLGKCIYEMAMGKDRQAFPSPPTLLEELPDRAELLELNEVITRACEPDPARRYQSAQAMLADLELLRQGHSVRRDRDRRKKLRLAARVGVLAGICALAAALIWAVNQHANHRELLNGDMDAADLNTNRWSWSHADWGDTNGRRSFSAKQTNGAIALHTAVEHQNGMSTGLSGWLDLRNNLRRTAPCRVEVGLSVAARGGRLALVITDRQSPTNDADLSGPSLLEFSAYESHLLNSTSMWNSPNLRVRLCPRSQAALVWPDAGREQDFGAVDLSSLPSWQLRFLCSAHSGSERPSGFVDLKLSKLRVFKVPDDEPLVGWVFEKVSGWPVANATVSDRTGELLTKTLQNGAFVVGKPPADGWLTVEKARFDTYSEQVLQPGEQAGLVRLQLHKRTEEFGDVLYTIPVPSEVAVQSVGFWQGRLSIMTAITQEKTCLLLGVDTAANSPWQISIPIVMWSFADCQGRLLAFSPWHGTNWDLTSGRAEMVAELQHRDGTTLNWPLGCAFDGQRLWFVENDGPKDRFALHAFDLERKTIVQSLSSTDRQIRGLAWDGQRFWVSSGDGIVYSLDRQKALSAITVEECRTDRKFKGNYTHLAYGGGHLWGLETDHRRICQIKVMD